MRYIGRMATPRYLHYAWSVAAAVACTMLGFAMQPRFDIVNIAMVYLLAVVVVALRTSRGPAIATALLSVLAFDVAFVPPQGTVKVEDAQYLLTFAIMVAVAVVIARLVEDIRREATAKVDVEVRAETERIRSTLLASISHDLRTPLAIIAGASSSLVDHADRLDAGERRDLAASVYREARRMADHVAKILQMTRLDAGAIAPDRDWNAPAEMVGAVLERLAERTARHRVIVELAPDLPLVRADAALIDHALANLLENAVDHTPAGTVVRVRVGIVDGEMLFTVQDNADGLDDRDVERVFDRFHRGTTEGNAAGIGLGLAICVRLHGGRTWAERIAAGGTAFHFALPLEPSPGMPAEAS
jgi:two-component system sensor histidine kinase KdpD